jgi:hypothetical protein
MPECKESHLTHKRNKKIKKPKKSQRLKDFRKGSTNNKTTPVCLPQSKYNRVLETNVAVQNACTDLALGCGLFFPNQYNRLIWASTVATVAHRKGHLGETSYHVMRLAPRVFTRKQADNAYQASLEAWKVIRHALRFPKSARALVSRQADVPDDLPVFALRQEFEQHVFCSPTQTTTESPRSSADVRRALLAQQTEQKEDTNQLHRKMCQAANSCLQNGLESWQELPVICAYVILVVVTNEAIAAFLQDIANESWGTETNAAAHLPRGRLDTRARLRQRLKSAESQKSQANTPADDSTPKPPTLFQQMLGLPGQPGGIDDRFAYDAPRGEVLLLDWSSELFASSFGDALRCVLWALAAPVSGESAWVDSWEFHSLANQVQSTRENPSAVWLGVHDVATELADDIPLYKAANIGIMCAELDFVGVLTEKVFPVVRDPFYMDQNEREEFQFAQRLQRTHPFRQGRVGELTTAMYKAMCIRAKMTNNEIDVCGGDLGQAVQIQIASESGFPVLWQSRYLVRACISLGCHKSPSHLRVFPTLAYGRNLSAAPVCYAHRHGTDEATQAIEHTIVVHSAYADVATNPRFQTKVQPLTARMSIFHAQ